jgi:hypothetical protein
MRATTPRCVWDGRCKPAGSLSEEGLSPSRQPRDRAPEGAVAPALMRDHSANVVAGSARDVDPKGPTTRRTGERGARRRAPDAEASATRRTRAPERTMDATPCTAHPPAAPEGSALGPTAPAETGWWTEGGACSCEQTAVTECHEGTRSFAPRKMQLLWLGKPDFKAFLTS